MMLSGNQSIIAAERMRLNRLDMCGFMLSSGCIIHCLLLPALLLIAPGLTHEVFENEGIHLALASFATLFVSVAALKGYDIHRSMAPLLLGGVGLSLLWGALLVEDTEWLERAVTGLGAAATAAAHIINHRKHVAYPREC